MNAINALKNDGVALTKDIEAPPAPTPAGDDFGDEPDNIHPLQR